MTKGQRRVLIAAAVLTVLAFLFPPVYSRDYEGFSYRFLIGSFRGRVEAWLLIAEFVGIGILAYIGWLLWADKPPPK